MHKFTVSTAIVFALLGVMSSSVFAQDDVANVKKPDWLEQARLAIKSRLFVEKEDPKEKYVLLEQGITERMEGEKNNQSSDSKQFAWKFLNFKYFPDCDGSVPTRTLKGLFFSADGVRNAFRVVNKNTWQDDGFIVVQAAVLSYTEDAISGKEGEKHYRAFRWKYSLENKEWNYCAVDRHVKTWICKKKPFDGANFTVEETCGRCVESGGSSSKGGAWWNPLTW